MCANRLVFVFWRLLHSCLHLFILFRLFFTFSDKTIDKPIDIATDSKASTLPMQVNFAVGKHFEIPFFEFFSVLLHRTPSTWVQLSLHSKRERQISPFTWNEAHIVHLIKSRKKKNRNSSNTNFTVVFTLKSLALKRKDYNQKIRFFYEAHQQRQKE